ncbi:hypothetical protein [Halomicrobium sp. IBSBa]|uniref:hypothetical protein n=1 Tax=Halomicrobium sp. IBSBa TaxID=2778916 RepID=UPI001ABEF41F|nr:hypothetical protein [Halomicrobium sp. IBSBa]
MPAVTIELSDDVYSYCRETVDRTEFETVEEYAAFVLEQVVEAGDDEERSTAAPDRDIEEQLESLGYR